MILQTCAFAVCSLIVNVFAISLFVCPSTTSLRTSYSLWVKLECVSLKPALDNCLAGITPLFLSLMYGTTFGSSHIAPSLIVLMIIIRNSVLMSLWIYPFAPAVSDSQTSLSEIWEVSIIILVLKLFCSSIRFVASIPDISGKPISISTMSGFNSRVFSIASLPFCASAIISISGYSSNSDFRPILISFWSSTRIILIVINTPSIIILHFYHTRDKKL